MADDGIEVVDLLVVDDNPGDLRLIEEAFRSEAVDPSIRTTTTREEALEFLSRHRQDDEPPTPLVVLLDWHLSQTTGGEVLEAAKLDERSIPVIVMTGSLPEASALEPTVEKADLLIEKPIDPSEYVEHVRSVLIER